MAYTDGEIRQFIREVVREAKDTAKVDTGFLRRSIKGALIGRDKSIEFEQIVYGAYNNNSRLIQIAERIVPNDLKWKVTFINEDGETTEVKGKTRTGRTIVRRQITSESIGTSKIKQLIKSIQIGKTKDDGTESSGEENN
tara:strand:+ start:138 stop:557 length:420 start_codon:yes stop_codon:yes gene_type:complete